MDDLDLLDWRERVARLYLSDLDLAGFRAARDELFRTHPSSPVPPADRPGFTGLRWYPPDPSAVVEAPLRPATGELRIDTGGRGLTVLPGDRVRLDANYLYNPSCAYDDRWACPLAPPENRVDVPLRAGERAYH
ncbi:DUF1684 domain-containing protein [Micromonospora tulbaghiae]|uniref:DUF1684 domain-containing protein n=1 Tax=Micromonospora tulbaghiae TaxID=479978 RepID=UPI0033C2034A